jgi:hypothetical protein
MPRHRYYVLKDATTLHVNLSVYSAMAAAHEQRALCVVRVAGCWRRAENSAMQTNERCA